MQKDKTLANEENINWTTRVLQTQQRSAQMTKEVMLLGHTKECWTQNTGHSFVNIIMVWVRHLTVSQTTVADFDFAFCFALLHTYYPANSNNTTKSTQSLHNIQIQTKTYFSLFSSATDKEPVSFQKSSQSKCVPCLLL